MSIPNIYRRIKEFDADGLNILKDQFRYIIQELDRREKRPRTITASAYLGNEDLVLADCTNGAITLTLPPPKQLRRRIAVKKIDSSSNALTITAETDSEGNQANIDGSSTLILTAQYNAPKIDNDTVNYWIV